MEMNYLGEKIPRPLVFSDIQQGTVFFRAMSHQTEVRTLRNEAQDNFEGKERKQMNSHQVLLAGGDSDRDF